MKTRKFSLALAVLLVILCSAVIPGVYATWQYFVNANPTMDSMRATLGGFEYGNIYIYEMKTVEEGSNYTSSSVKKKAPLRMGGELNLGSNGSASITYRVTFYNTTENMYAYAGTTDVTYDNTNISYRVITNKNFIDGQETMTMDVVFSYASGRASSDTTLSFLTEFLFQEVDKIRLTIPEGNSADNPASLYDGSTNYNGNDTNERWTNWTSTTSGRGEPATLSVVWEDAVTFDAIKLFHFVDANRNSNWYGSCDLPESVTIYYYDETAQDYVELTYTESKNYSNAKRRASDGVYQMTIGGKTVTFTYSYTGTPPITTYTFNKKITTRAIKVVVDAKANFFVGLMEMQVLNGTTNVMTA